jgi:hypothetical protein
MIKMLYDNCDFLKTMIQAVPENNSHFYYLQNNADLPFSEDANEAEVKSDTFFYKISWKGKYLLKTAEGEDTVYSKWVKECIELETTKSEK